jgi:hypothetical protein
MSKGGRGYNEESVVPKLLVQWGSEKLTELIESSREIPAAGLVLDSDDWPAGPEARELLGRCGLV